MSKSKSGKRVESTMDVTELMNLLDKNHKPDQSERGQEAESASAKPQASEQPAETKQQAAFDRLRELTAERRKGDADTKAKQANAPVPTDTISAAGEDGMVEEVVSAIEAEEESQQGQLELAAQAEAPAKAAQPKATPAAQAATKPTTEAHTAEIPFAAEATSAEVTESDPAETSTDEVKAEASAEPEVDYKRAEPLSKQPDASIPSETREAIERARRISTPSETTSTTGKTPHHVSADQWQQMLQAVKEEKELAARPAQTMASNAGSPQTRAVKWGLRTLLTFVIVSVAAVAFIGLLYVIDQKADEWADANDGQLEGSIAPAAGSRYQAGDILPEPYGEGAPALPKPRPVQIPIQPTPSAPEPDPLLELLTTP